MTTPPSAARPTPCLLLFLICLIHLLAGDASAVPPATPSDGHVEFTRFGFPYNNTNNPPSNAWYSWNVTWKDNAIDEDGYQVFVRFGSSGPFYPASQLAPNSTSIRVSTGIPGSGAGTPVHFQVVPWKFNGSTTEASTYTIATAIPPADGKSALAPPDGLTATSLDLDPSPAGVLADDGQVVLSWNDKSSQELHYALEMREFTGTDGAWTFIGVLPFNTTTTTLSNRTVLPSSTSTQINRLQLVPGKTYEFKVRTGRGYLAGVPNFSEGANTSNPAQTTAPHFTVPALRAPSDLSAAANGESLITLSWKDNSSNETGYEVQYRTLGDTAPPWETLGTLGENVSSVNVPVPQKATAEFQIRAVYNYRPTGASSDTTLYSDFSPIVTSGAADFQPPTNLTASSSGVAHTIDLAWTDKSSTEQGFNIYCRPAGTAGTFNFCRALPADVTKVSVDSFTTGNPLTANPPTTQDPGGTLTFTPFTAGNAYEFVVRAVGSNESSVFSLDSNTAVATARDGFTSRLYQPVTQGQEFTHTVTLSNQAAVSPFTATGLPPGLSFNASNGQITGTPSESGFFPVTLRATYSAGHTAEVILMLRVLPALGSPVMAEDAEIGDRTVGLNDPMRIPLNGRFTDADTEFAVKIDTTKGAMDLGLYYSLAPETVTNFANYVLNGDYTNMVFHRLVPGFVLQGGFLKAVAAPRSFTRVTARPSPPNEPGISNLRGTVAAAKLGARDSTAYRAATSSTNPRDDTYGYLGNPDSASIDFFFNLANNSTNLDNQNEGFTAFARVATPGLSVMDAIAALPRGSYLNNNSGSTYNPELDKRILIDGSLTPFSGIPIDASTVPADMDITKTVRVNSISFINPVAYTVDSQATDIATVAVENGDQLRVTGLKAGTRPVILTARDIDGNTATMNFSINVQPGYKRPVITKQPVPVVAKPGSPVTYSVKATGTSLVYRWRKDGEEISGQTGAGSATYTLPTAQEGLYDVIVSNDAEAVLSTRVRLDVVKPPVIGDPLPHKLVEAGSELKLEADLDAGSPSPSFTWKRGIATVKNQTGRTLLINSATLADAGIYQGFARNSAGTASTSQASVVVVQKTSQLQVEKPGTTVRINAPAAGPDLLYQWYKNSIIINAGTDRFSGTQDAVLTIESADPTQDVGIYTCEIQAPEGLGTHMTGEVHLALSNKPVLNALTGAYSLRDGIVGNGYQYYLPYDRTANNNASSYTITGLPPGLTYDKGTGLIYGRPTKAGSFNIRATATNKAGTSDPVTGVLRIYPLGAGLCGTFAANVSPSTTLNDNKGGRIQVTVTDNASFTGSLQMGKDTYNIKGTLVIYDTVTDSNGNSLIAYAGLVQLPRKGQSSLSLIVQIIEGTNSFSGSISDSSGTAAFSGHRLIWDRTRRPLSGIAQVFNIALEPETARVGQQDTPQGAGYASLTLQGSGTTSLAGRLADGTTLTSSSFASQTLAVENEAQTNTRLEIQTDFFLRLNKDTASLMPSLKMVLNSTSRQNLTGQSFNRVEGQARWIKALQPASERAYQPGFNATTLTATGALYVAPGTNRVVMGLPNVAGNAILDFSEGGLASATPNPDIPAFRITSSHVGSIADPNLAFVSFSVTPSTGLFRGSFKLSDSRKVNFEGLCINDSISDPEYGSAYRPPSGAGFFLLPGTTPSISKSAILSGRVSLKAPTITFTTQPVSQIVDESTLSQSVTVSFTAAATGLPGIVYQWYRNGEPITAATGQTYTIVGVGTAHVGSYVCVASSGVLQTASNTATLSLKTPVTSVTIARSPTDAAVSAGTAVTYTATATGSEEIFYQWYLGTTPIEGATGKTYTFVAQTANAGAYKVTARNAKNAEGTSVASEPDNLNVVEPVTSVTATRTPASTALRPEASVTFEATANGTGTKEYQWYKGTTLITGATSSTYYIASLDFSDAGSYHCEVRNEANGNPVSSNDLPLEIRDLIYNVVASREPLDEYVAVGTATVTFGVDAQGGGVRTYSWKKGGQLVSGGDTQFLTLNNVTSADSGIYVCHVSSDLDPEGMDSNPVQLLVIEPVTSATLTLQSPASTTVAPNTTLTFDVDSDGGGTKTYILRRDNVEIKTETSSSMTTDVGDVPGTYVYKVQVISPITPGGVLTGTITITVQAPE
jgi:cyclophilin family peptidyl-prolyl cis-trans isomerase